ncbi:uncharacterized protein K452DRAFT_121523 [Aplosporella prunicola CBS 121167]|uniref:Uncharacterized protein n=1 Tax=Aplosporella prunicola CBS 121167 TaxID=1176127 RepID=A0A6A6BQ10_9PEZI|nr:uncharacterized protein K452DRAFT_121523 [Aplosporella prunicola CBS 121167]KAF2145533.1 hypothetical protein K452DRAFT_121523 [Aplosporella prunicola CBS 121167]
MPRIIEDSDDEGDFGSLSPVSQDAPLPPSGNQPSKNALMAHEEELSVPSASFTDITHRNVTQEDPAPNGEPGSVDAVPGRLKSPAISRKRRLSMSSSGYGQSPPKMIERRKTVRTYGSSSQRKHDLFDEQNSAFEAMREQEQTTHSSSEKPSNDLAGQVERADKPGNGEDVAEPAPTWRMPEAMADDFAQHEPQMFADFLSTVPDATMTQQRLVEAALAERDMNEQDEALVRQRMMERPSDNPSVAWSDWLHSSEIRGHPEEQSIEQPPTHASESLSVSHAYRSTPPESSHRAKSTEYQPTGSEVITTQSKGLRRSKTTNSASPLHSSRRDDSADELSLPTHEPTKKQKKKMSAIKSNNIPSESNDTGSTKRSRSRPIVIDDDSDSDDVTLEMLLRSQ